uniref:Zgc:136493 n=1 Tax=Myripristis murdjan TaxID=586833 RepID=A0A667WYY4_9TELE
MEEDKPCALISEAWSEHAYLKELSDLLKQHFHTISYREFLQNPALHAPKIQAIFMLAQSPAAEPSLLRSLPSLKVIANGGVGINHLDLLFIGSLGVKVTNTPGVVSDATADIGMGLLLASARKIHQHMNQAEKCATILTQYTCPSNIAGRISGSLGHTLITMRSYCYRNVTPSWAVGATYCENMDDLLRRSDFVMLAVNLTPETTGLIGQRELSLMKPTATLVNVSRGEQSGTIHAAALDVTHPEPLPRDHPLLGLPNVLITPHVGTDTYQTTRRMVEVVVENAQAALNGLPIPNEVKP